MSPFTTYVYTYSLDNLELFITSILPTKYELVHLFFDKLYWEENSHGHHRALFN